MSARGRGRPSRAEVLRTLDRALADLSSVGGLPLPLEADAIWEGIWYEEAHHSTAIEGNTLVLKEVERLLREGKAVGSKELAEYLEVEEGAGCRGKAGDHCSQTRSPVASEG